MHQRPGVVAGPAVGVELALLVVGLGRGAEAPAGLHRVDEHELAVVVAGVSMLMPRIGRVPRSRWKGRWRRCRDGRRRGGSGGGSEALLGAVSKLPTTPVTARVEYTMPPWVSPGSQIKAGEDPQPHCGHIILCPKTA